MFIAYIVEELMTSFGARWMADAQIESIKKWESRNSLDSELSENYGSSLELFVQNNLVYESSWTSYGNPREYTLGWGGLADAFDDSKPNWANEYHELEATLTPEKYANARCQTR
ncbi:MAG: hypothetical protein PHZ09_06885 [Eubacteriales bacterium]|nr:hypothetical protein [Eubacteriales bacterium]